MFKHSNQEVKPAEHSHLTVFSSICTELLRLERKKVKIVTEKLRNLKLKTVLKSVALNQILVKHLRLLQNILLKKLKKNSHNVNLKNSNLLRTVEKKNMKEMTVDFLRCWIKMEIILLQERKSLSVLRNYLVTPITTILTEAPWAFIPMDQDRVKSAMEA